MFSVAVIWAALPVAPKLVTCISNVPPLPAVRYPRSDRWFVAGLRVLDHDLGAGCGRLRRPNATTPVTAATTVTSKLNIVLMVVWSSGLPLIGSNLIEECRCLLQLSVCLREVPVDGSYVESDSGCDLRLLRP
jgi:hypothetical protein